MDTAEQFKEHLKKAAAEKYRTESETAATDSEPLVGQIASAYEKIRSVLDYRETNSLRRYAIERYLIRTFRPEHNRALGERLIKELILAEYLPSNLSGKKIIEQVDEIIRRYRALYQNLSARTGVEEKYSILREVIAIASAEIENAVGLHKTDFIILKNFRGQIWEELKPDLPTDSNARALLKNRLLLAEAKSLLEADDAMLRLILLSEFVPGWTELDPATVNSIPDLKSIVKTINAYLADTERNRLSNLLQPVTPPYTVLIDLIRKNPGDFENILAEERLIGENCRQIINQKNLFLANNLSRSVVRSIGYLLLTKSILAIAVEIPYDLAVAGTVHYLPLIVNLLFPPILLLILTRSVQIPKTANTTKIITTLKNVLNKDDCKIIPENLAGQLVIPPYRRPFVTFALTFSVGIALGLVLLALYGLHFSIVSMLLFVFFISVVSFLAYRISQNARRLAMIPQREQTWNIFVDFFSLPFLQMGKWFTEKLAKANIFLLMIDLLIESPLKKLLEFMEIWIRFVRQKKQEIG